ncbi:MAG: ABC transporter ATP-binding protein, partial [Anaerolineae bacterium]
MSDDIILETYNVRKEFGALVAVADVSIRVVRGTLHSIIGPNGAGKTT